MENIERGFKIYDASYGGIRYHPFLKMFYAGIEEAEKEILEAASGGYADSTEFVIVPAIRLKTPEEK